MKENFIADLTPGKALHSTFLVQSKEKKLTRAGKPYFALELRDRSGVLPAKLWDADQYATAFEVDDIVEVRGRLELYQGSPQIVIEDLHSCRDGDVDLMDYLPHTAQNVDQLLEGLVEKVRAFTNPSLKALLLSLLEDPAIVPKLKQAPAGKTMHHAYLGGLLEHIVSLFGLSERVAQYYPPLDGELLAAGAILHDLGKIEELSFARAIDYTTRGRLLGHMAIALEMLHEHLRGLPDFPSHLQMKLEHLILSHHGEYQFGSPVLPAFPEAVALHYLDNLDSKLQSISAQYGRDAAVAGEWTEWNRALERRLLKPAAANSQAGHEKDIKPHDQKK